MNEFLDRFAASVAPVLAFDTDIHADHAEGLWATATPTSPAVPQRSTWGIAIRQSLPQPKSRSAS